MFCFVFKILSCESKSYKKYNEFSVFPLKHYLHLKDHYSFLNNKKIIIVVESNGKWDSDCFKVEFQNAKNMLDYNEKISFYQMNKKGKTGIHTSAQTKIKYFNSTLNYLINRKIFIDEKFKSFITHKDKDILNVLKTQFSNMEYIENKEGSTVKISGKRSGSDDLIMSFAINIYIADKYFTDGEFFSSLVNE